MENETCVYFLSLLNYVFFFNTVFCWLFGDFHIIQPWSHSLPSSPRSAPTLVTSPLPSQIKKEGEERKINLKVQLRCSYIQWSTVNAPMASLLKKIESFPLTPLPEAVSYGELHFSMLSLFIHLFGFFLFMTGFFCVAQTVLELSLLNRLASNS